MQWFKGLKLAYKIVITVVIVIGVIWAALWFRGLLFGEVELEARLGNEQTGAAVDTGETAIDTIGTNQREEGDRDAALGEAQGRVSGADTATESKDAGLDALCANNGICED